MRKLIALFITLCLLAMPFATVSLAESAEYAAGVTVEDNADSQYAAPYQATFVYEDTDEKDAVSVTVAGNFQFGKWEDPAVVDFMNEEKTDEPQIFSVYEYEPEGMFNTTTNAISYEMEETADEHFELTLPLPGNLYYYDYTVTYDDETQVTIQDPANPSAKNENTGNDSNHSLFYVGEAANTTIGQEKIYARPDQNGTVEYVSYTAADGTDQPLGIYLPYGYDPEKTYKTIYVSHGGGGNEAEWMGIGALPNIMDNLIAEGLTEEVICVTMNHSYMFGLEWFEADPMKAQNMKENIIPYVEEHYSVSKDPADRAVCGLSGGAATTLYMVQHIADTFGYYGIFSETKGGFEEGITKEQFDGLVIYQTAGVIDFGRAGTTLFADKLDELGVEHGFDIFGGGHDWGMWRQSFTTFVTDYLWKAE